MKILLLDTGGETHFVTVDFLKRRFHHEVDFLKDNESAIKVLNESKFDMVFVRWDSGSVAPVILQAKWLNIPVIVMSGLMLHEIQDKINKMPDIEVRDILLIPFNAEELGEFLNQLN